MFAGIGRSIETVQQIDDLQRPLAMEEGGVLLMDLLWSDPTTNDAVEGVQPSPRGPGLVTFGPDRVKEFCQVQALCKCAQSYFECPELYRSQVKCSAGCSSRVQAHQQHTCMLYVP